MRRSSLPLVALLPLLVACPPTLSRPHSPAYEDHLAAGERHMRHGRYEESAREWSLAAEAADRRVDRDEAQYRQSRALKRLGRWEEAVALLDGIAARRPPSRRTARAILDASLIRYEHLDRPDEALAGFESILRRHSDEGPAARALVLLVAHHRERSLDDALRVVGQLGQDLADTDLGDDLLALEADLRLEADDRQGARRALERIVAEHPYPQGHRWDDAIEQLAEMDVEDGRADAAIERLEAMLERAESTTMVGSYTLPAFPRAQLRIARIQRDQLRDYAAAEVAFDAVYDDFPDSTLRDDARVELGEMLLEQGESRRACRILRDAIEEFEVGRARRRAVARVARDCGSER